MLFVIAPRSGVSEGSSPVASAPIVAITPATSKPTTKGSFMSLLSPRRIVISTSAAIICSAPPSPRVVVLADMTCPPECPTRRSSGAGARGLVLVLVAAGTASGAACWVMGFVLVRTAAARPPSSSGTPACCSRFCMRSASAPTSTPASTPAGCRHDHWLSSRGPSLPCKGRVSGLGPAACHPF